MYSNLNLNNYKTFYDVATYGSVSLASKNMMVSQPAISRSIKKLESDLNVTLFYRTLNGMVLTEKGKELYNYVEEAYNSIKIGESKMMEKDNLEKGKLSIGISNDISSNFMIDAINKFHLDYPGIEIKLINRNTNELINMLENHKIDFIIDKNKEIDSCLELNSKSLFESQYLFVSNKEENISKLQDIENKTIIIPDNNLKLKEYLLNNNIVLNKCLIMDDYNMIKNSILKGTGIGFILEDNIKDELSNGSIIKMDIKDLPKVTNYLIYNEKSLMNASKLFINEYL